MNYISLLAILAVVCGSNAVDVEKVFKENQIVPDMIPVPPKKALNVKNIQILRFFFQTNYKMC